MILLLVSQPAILADKELGMFLSDIPIMVEKTELGSNHSGVSASWARHSAIRSQVTTWPIGRVLEYDHEGSH